MITASISQIKSNPMAVFNKAVDFPLQIKNREKTTGYYLDKELFEKIVDYLEDIEDKKVIDKTDFSKGTDFETFAKELGI